MECCEGRTFSTRFLFRMDDSDEDEFVRMGVKLTDLRADSGEWGETGWGERDGVAEEARGWALMGRACCCCTGDSWMGEWCWWGIWGVWTSGDI